MLSPEVLNRLPPVAFWVVFALCVGLFVLQKLAEAGMLGPLGKWFRSRAEARKRQWQREVREAVDAPDYKAMQRRVTWLEKMVVKLEAEIKKLELVEEVHEAHRDMTAEYLRLDAQWHIDASMIAAEQRFRMLPPHTSYTKFVRDYREKQGLENGRRWTDNPEPQQQIDWSQE